MSDGLLGAIIGAAAAIFGGFFAELIKHNWDKKSSQREQRKSTYEDMQIAVMKYGITETPFQVKEETIDYFASIKARSLLYASASVNACFNEISAKLIPGERNQKDIDFIKQKNRELIKLMRRDLGSDL